MLHLAARLMTECLPRVQAPPRQCDLVEGVSPSDDIYLYDSLHNSGYLTSPDLGSEILGGHYLVNTIGAPNASKCCDEWLQMWCHCPPTPQKQKR